MLLHKRRRRSKSIFFSNRLNTVGIIWNQMTHSYKMPRFSNATIFCSKVSCNNFLTVFAGHCNSAYSFSYKDIKFLLLLKGIQTYGHLIQPWRWSYSVRKLMNGWNGNTKVCQGSCRQQTLQTESGHHLTSLELHEKTRWSKIIS